MKKRDPRVDPRPGDVIVNRMRGGDKTLTVESIGQCVSGRPRVTYTQVRTKRLSAYTKNFAREHRNWEVIHAADATNPTTITHGGETYVRLGAVLAEIEGERMEQLRRRDQWEKVYGKEASVQACSYASMVVRDLGSALIEEYGDPNEAEDYAGPTDADHDREEARLNRRDDARELNRERGL